MTEEKKDQAPGDGAEGADEKKGNAFVDYFRNFKVLKETGREYWGMQIVNFIDHTIFFALVTIAVIFFSDDPENFGFGFSDENAGYVYAIFGSLTTICLFFSGLFSDWLGVRKSMFVNQGGVLVLRAAIVFLALSPDFMPESRGAIMSAVFIAQAPFLAIGQTAFQAANKRFTTKKSRSAGFNLWYLFMNIGALLAGLLIDFLWLIMELPRVHIFTTGIFTAVICMVVIFLMVKREEQRYGEDEEREEEPEEKKKLSPLQNVKAVLAEPIFWRFTCLVALLLGVRAVFLYMHLLMPKFWLRVIGPDAYIGLLTAINPALVIIGLILLIPILHKYSVYKMLVYGAMVSGLSLFVLAIPSTGEACYTISIIALVVLTVGEVIWSPRLTEFTAAIAPEGQEGTYLGLSMVPYFLAKTAVGFMSGHMLSRWVPEPKDEAGLGLRESLEAGEVAFWDSPSAMWVILGIVAFVGPLIALLLKNWFTKGTALGAKPVDEAEA